MPQKYRDRLLKAAITLVKANGGDTNHAIEGDLDFLQAVDEVMEEISERRSVKIDASETMPPSAHEEPKGVLVEKPNEDEYQPHTGDYDILDALTALRWNFDSILEEAKGLPQEGGNEATIIEAADAGIGDLNQLEQTAFFAVIRERARQNQKHGGDEHDRTHTLDEWVGFIKQRANVLELVALTQDDDGLPTGEATVEDFTLRLDYDHTKVRKLLIEIAALAVAAVEVHDWRHER